MTNKPNLLVRLGRLIRGVFTVVRTLVQLIVLLVLLAVLLVVFQGSAVQVPDSGALILAPTGLLVDELSGDPVSRALNDVQGIPPQETLVNDLVEALDVAAEDDRIQAVVLSLGGLQGGGLSKLREVGQALVHFRETGKPVIAMGDAYSQAQYYLAAHADEVYLHQFGSIFLDGFGYFRTYYREALEKLKIDMEVFRVGEYKSFVEPFTRDNMSVEDKESARRWLDFLWAAYREDIVAARELEPGAVDDYANQFAELAEAQSGDLAQTALSAGLVDGLQGRLEFESYMVDQVGAGESDGAAFSAIDHRAYLQAARQFMPEEQLYNVGVLVAAGQIVDGEAQAGTVGGDTLADLVRQAANDDAIDAVVLRVDSPGGSMFASEVVFEALNALQVTGKPLVASMGSVAASGGYYIAMGADEILADPTTITGSIGVGALLPTFPRSLASLGVRSDGIGTTRLSGQSDLLRGLGPETRRVIQASVDEAYRQFIQRVADSREMSIERTDNVARGRVWVGADAVDLGLVDRLGGLEDAVRIAAERAGIEGEDYGVRYVEPELNMRAQFALQLISGAARLARSVGLSFPVNQSVGLEQIIRNLSRDLEFLGRLNDPGHLYLHCFCELR
ncbi:MAG: signal peptide peptidase SppA [Gammaproteobacteria bacterium]